MSEALTRDEVTRLLDAMHRLARAQSEAEVIATVRGCARALVQSDGISFVLREGEEVHYVDEDAISPLWKGRRFPIDACVSGWAIRHREQVTIDDIFTDSRVPIEAYRPTFVKSLAMVPMNRHLPIGAIGAYWATNHLATSHELELLQALADATSTALTNVALLAAERRASAEREALLRAAQEANRTKDEFLAMLGHELRNPLAPMVTALQLLRLRGEEPPPREIEVIERQVSHLVRLVDDLLDVSRITRGTVVLKREELELASVVHQALELAGPLLEQRSHHVDVSVPSEGFRIMGDPSRLAQTVANLLTNAAKYTDSGGHIAITAARKGDEVTLSVTDSGIGIDPVLLPRVFEMFVQGPQAGDRARGGLGLGLALVQRLVEAHGGRVSAHSDGAGKGSTFTVVLPTAERARAASGTDVSESTAPAVREKVNAPILVVDDNRDAADLVAESLRAYGFDAKVAFDGPSALALVETFAPEIAILDIGLPVMDGYELATRLWERIPKLRVVALSGYGQEHDRRRSHEAGFAEHLVKPVTPRRLLDVLRQLA